MRPERWRPNPGAQAAWRRRGFIVFKYVLRPWQIIPSAAGENPRAQNPPNRTCDSKRLTVSLPGMAAAPKFLIVDDNGDSRRLLVRTLRRKFSQAVIVECDDPATAVSLASTEKFDAIIGHR